MNFERPREHLDTIHDLRVKKDFVAVHELADAIWSAWTGGGLTEAVGLGAVCQEAYLSARNARAHANRTDDSAATAFGASAELWYSRAMSASAQTQEINTLAVLLLPRALAAYEEGDEVATFAILDELERLANFIADGHASDQPGVPLNVIRRSVHERRGYYHWRSARYREALEEYEHAEGHVRHGTRDAVRVAAGIRLSQIGIGLAAAGAIDQGEEARVFRELAASAKQGGWEDILEPLMDDADRLDREVIRDARELRSLEGE